MTAPEQNCLRSLDGQSHLRFRTRIDSSVACRAGIQRRKRLRLPPLPRRKPANPRTLMSASGGGAHGAGAGRDARRHVAQPRHQAARAAARRRGRGLA